MVTYGGNGLLTKITVMVPGRVIVGLLEKEKMVNSLQRPKSKENT